MVSMRFEGGQELARALAGLSTRLSKSLQRDALMEGAEPIRASAERNAPRDPGAPDLADNITAAPLRATAGRGDAAVGIGPTARAFFYDYFQEMGTARHAAHPFYRPALDGESPTAIPIIGQAMWRELAGRGIQRPMRQAPSGVIGEV